MDEELETELERLKNEKVVSEQTAAIYLGKLRAELNKEEQQR
jgi:hypothetical protein